MTTGDRHDGERIDIRRAPPGANGLYIIPTPPITIRHPAASPTGPHYPSGAYSTRLSVRPTDRSGNEEDDVDTESAEVQSEAETEGVYSVHTTSDIGSVSAMTSESGASASSWTGSSRSSGSDGSFGRRWSASSSLHEDVTRGDDGTEDESGSDTEVPSEDSFLTSTPHSRESNEDSSDVKDDAPRVERSRVPRSVSAAFFPRSVSAPFAPDTSGPASTHEQRHPTAHQSQLYNSPAPLIGQTRIVPGDMRATYGIKTLPILSLYIPDPKSFPALLRHLHDPREPLIPALAGFDPVKEPINSTAQLQVRLYALSAYDLLVRVESFRRFVANLAALGVGARATWQQVEMVHQAFIRVLTHRGGIYNAELERIAVPMMEGEGLPGVVFSKYDELMLEEHHRWAALRRVKAEGYGLVPLEEPHGHAYGM